MKTPYFSVIVPAHNAEDRMRRGLDTIRGQTFRDFELIIVCDDCQDRTAEIAREYTDRVYEVGWHSCGKTRNKGLDEARGEWILFMDDDDWWTDREAFRKIAISGGDPLEYLGECGSESPDKLWWYIKDCLKKAQPDLYAQIPSGRKKTEKKKDEPKTLDGSAWVPYQVEPVTGVVQQPLTVTDLKVETVDDDMKIYGLTTKVGDFQMAGDKLRWINPEDNEHIYLTVDTWKQLLEVVPRVMEVMKL